MITEKEQAGLGDMDFNFLNEDETLLEGEDEGGVESDSLDLDLTEEEEALLKRVVEKQGQQDPIMNGFKSLTTKPSEAQIEEWKRQHGKVFTIGFHQDEYYIFRSLKRLEWRNLMKALTKQEDDAKRKEAICLRAVLWPTLNPQSLAEVSAGTPDTLYEMILQASNFLMPQEALTCVRKL
jgi:hypothetical protein